MDQRDKQPIPTILWITAFLIIFFALSGAYLTPPTHDYALYLDNWQAIVQGRNPWAMKTNAYGPVHSALAVLYSWHINLPRLLFVLLWLISSFGIATLINKNEHLPKEHKYFLYFTLFLSPLFWVFVVRYGTNDILMAFFVLAAIALFQEKKDIVSGFFMAVAIAVKFIPIMMVPFLVLTKKRIRWRFAFSLAITTVVIFGVSYLLWGNNIFYPFQMAGERPSKILSIFRFLRGELSPLRVVVDHPDLDWMSVYFSILSVLIFFFAHIKYGLKRVLSSIIALGFLLMFYKVGHHQFYITLIMLIVLWISSDYKQIVDASVDLTAVYIFIIWIAFVSFLYVLTEGYAGTNWREIFGLPTFIITGWMLFSLCQYSWKTAVPATPPMHPDESKLPH